MSEYYYQKLSHQNDFCSFKEYKKTKLFQIPFSNCFEGGYGTVSSNIDFTPSRVERRSFMVATEQRVAQESVAVSSARPIESVALFVSNALTPEHLSTTLIMRRLAERGRIWPTNGNRPEPVLWLKFPVYPKSNRGKPTLVLFYIIPRDAMSFLKGVKTGEAYRWVEKTITDVVERTLRQGFPTTIGWGAFTKNATRHGEQFWDKNQELRVHPWVQSTHGDEGSVALILDAMQRAAIPSGARIVVLGGYGAIGKATALSLGPFRPSRVTLVGPPGQDKLERLLAVACEVTDGLGSEVQVTVSQDMATAAVRDHSNVAVVATRGDQLVGPEFFPDKCLVFDVTAPAACQPHADWGQGRMVLSAGTGWFADRSVIPFGFGEIAGETVWNLGVGVERGLWGCTAVTIAKACFGARQQHVMGPEVPFESVSSCRRYFPLLGFEALPPTMFGRRFSWDDVRAFVARHIG